MEQIARLNTGAAPSHEQMKMLDALKGGPAKFEEAANSFFGTPTAAAQTMKSLTSLVDQSDEHVQKALDSERQALVNTHMGPNGMAKTAAQKAAAQGRIQGLFGTVTTRTPQGEVPRYDNTGNAPAPAQIPAGAIPGKMNGKRGYVVNGQFTATE
jgi:hypothetical protein